MKTLFKAIAGLVIIAILIMIIAYTPWVMLSFIQAVVAIFILIIWLIISVVFFCGFFDH